MPEASLVTIFYYKGHDAFIFDFPKNRVVLFHTELLPFGEIAKQLNNREVEQLYPFLSELEKAAPLINSGDILARKAALASLIPHPGSNKVAMPHKQIAIQVIEEKLFDTTELPPLFSAIKNRDQKELLLAGLHRLTQLKQKGAMQEMAEAFLSFDQRHPIFEKNDWFDDALACYFANYLSDAKLSALGLLSTLIPYRASPEITKMEVVPLDSTKGREFFSQFYRGILKKEKISSTYQTLVSELKANTPLEKLIVRISCSQQPKMQKFNSFVLQGACYYSRKNTFYITHLMPFTFHKLLTLHFGENVPHLKACFGYSETLSHWRQDERPISIPCTRIPVMPYVHNQEFSHLIEVLVHDSVHQLICSHIPKKDRDRFRHIAYYLEKKLQSEINIDHKIKKKLQSMVIFFYDMPFSAYTTTAVAQDLAFEVSLVGAIYRTIVKQWNSVFTQELITQALCQSKAPLNHKKLAFFEECHTYTDSPLLSETLKLDIKENIETIKYLQNTLLEILK